MVGLRQRLRVRLTALHAASRQRKLELFLELCGDRLEEGILDVGVNPRRTHSYENLLEQQLGDRVKIVAVSLDNPGPLRPVFPAVRFVQADGCELPFGDRVFGTVFSNAVIEHVGDESAQRRFVEELVRVARSGFITTPNFWFPIEQHSSLPLIHFLARRPRRLLIRLLKGERHADYMRGVRLLSAARLRKLFPPRVKVEVHRLRQTFWPEQLVAHFTS